MNTLLKINKIKATIAGIAVIGVLATLIFYLTYTLPARCIFDILAPDEIVEVFFEVKNTGLNNPETEIFPSLSSAAKNFLQIEETSLNAPIPTRGEFFSFVNTEARILYAPGYSMFSGEPITRVMLHIPPYQGDDINQWHKYELLVEALTKLLGEPQMRGWAHNFSEVSFWQIKTGVISLSLNRNYRISTIIMNFSTEIREPVLLPFD